MIGSSAIASSASGRKPASSHGSRPRVGKPSTMILFCHASQPGYIYKAACANNLVAVGSFGFCRASYTLKVAKNCVFVEIAEFSRRYWVEVGGAVALDDFIRLLSLLMLSLSATRARRLKSRATGRRQLRLDEVGLRRLFEHFLATIHSRKCLFCILICIYPFTFKRAHRRAFVCTLTQRPDCEYFKTQQLSTYFLRRPLMIIGSCVIHLYLPGTVSLKDKRHRLKPLLHQLRRPLRGRRCRGGQARCVAICRYRHRDRHQRHRSGPFPPGESRPLDRGGLLRRAGVGLADRGVVGINLLGWRCLSSRRGPRRAGADIP